MDFLQFIDMLLHADQYLGVVIEQYGTLIYAILFAIVFCETGLVIFPFLPGDTLLFIAGAFCATGEMHIGIVILLLLIAAVSGNTLNYWIGRAIGQRGFNQEFRWLDKNALLKTQSFYERHGGKTIILSRYLPVVRTFAPFVAGISHMAFARFQFFNVAGALLWVLSLVGAGYFFGNIPILRDYLPIFVLLGIAVAVIPVAAGGLWRLTRSMQHR